MVIYLRIRLNSVSVAEAAALLVSITMTTAAKAAKLVAVMVNRPEKRALGVHLQRITEQEIVVLEEAVLLVLAPMRVLLQPAEKETLV